MRKFLSGASALLQRARSARASRAPTFTPLPPPRSHQFSAFSALAGSACLAGSAVALLSCGGKDESSSSVLVEESLADKLKSNYAARIATYSSPEKVFMSYASKTRDGEKFMTMNDFVDSLCPFEKKRSNKGAPTTTLDS